jgi:hypothetical protein
VGRTLGAATGGAWRDYRQGELYPSKYATTHRGRPPDARPLVVALHHLSSHSEADNGNADTNPSERYVGGSGARNDNYCANNGYSEA